MWSSFHAARSDTALKPSFHFPMRKQPHQKWLGHKIGLVKRTAEHLHPHQVPLLAVDQPLYTLAKKKISGPFLKSFAKTSLWWCVRSVWLWVAEAVKEAELVTSEAAGKSLLKASSVMRSRYGHQVTFVVLYSLLKRAYWDSGTNVALNVCP